MSRHVDRDLPPARNDGRSYGPTITRRSTSQTAQCNVECPRPFRPFDYELALSRDLLSG